METHVPKPPRQPTPIEAKITAAIIKAAGHRRARLNHGDALAYAQAAAGVLAQRPKPVDPIQRPEPGQPPKDADRVLPLLAEGLTVPLVAARLDLTENQASGRVQAIKRWLGADSIREAVTIARHRGLLPEAAPGGDRLTAP